ncbi:hypothetical protein ACB092_09G068900 [Castanea dentata]
MNIRFIIFLTFFYRKLTHLEELKAPSRGNTKKHSRLYFYFIFNKKIVPTVLRFAILVQRIYV